jgi:hypothetical protein
VRARVSDLDPYAGTAANLVELGIPAIVAMQFEISDEAAIAFSAAMYTALMSGHTVDLAVTLARQAILTTSRIEWATRRSTCGHRTACSSTSAVRRYPSRS